MFGSLVPDWRHLPRFIAASVLLLICGFVGLSLFIRDVVRKGPRRMFYSKTRTVVPDVLRKPEFGTHEFIRLPKSGIKLHYVVNGPADKPLMLLLHGFPEFWYSWRFQLREFSKDYRVVAVDMRGYGESDKPSSVSDYLFDNLVGDVDQLITALGYEKCILLAHDWGAVIAWLFAALHPERIDRLVVCTIPNIPAYLTYLKTKDAILSQTRKSWYVYFFQLPVIPELLLLGDDLSNLEAIYCSKSTGAKPGVFTAEDIDAYKYTFAKYSDIRAGMNYYRSAVRYVSNSVAHAERCRKIAVPTLLIWGTNDACVDNQLAELTPPHVEKCTIRYIEGASHWIQQEEPEKVNLYIRQFLSQQI